MNLNRELIKTKDYSTVTFKHLCLHFFLLIDQFFKKRDSPSRKRGDLQRISLIFWSNRAFISLCRVPSRVSAPAGTQEPTSSRLSVLPSLLDVPSDRQSPLGMRLTCLPSLSWFCICQWESGLRFTAGVRGEVVCFRGQLRERVLVRTGVGDRRGVGVSRVRLTLAGDDGGISGKNLVSSCGTG